MSNTRNIRNPSSRRTGNPRGRPRAEDSRTKERREYIRKQIEKKGYYGISKIKIARKYNVNVEIIYSDIEHVLDHINIIDAEEIKFELSRAYKDIWNDAWQKYKDRRLTHDERIKYGQVALKSMNQITDFLDVFGIKDVQGMHTQNQFRKIVFKMMKEEAPELFQELLDRMRTDGMITEEQ